ncbi:MAG: hypothetical protein ACKV2T_23695 [Kofleriaceae bacterium]
MTAWRLAVRFGFLRSLLLLALLLLALDLRLDVRFVLAVATSSVIVVASGRVRLRISALDAVRGLDVAEVGVRAASSHALPEGGSAEPGRDPVVDAPSDADHTPHAGDHLREVDQRFAEPILRRIVVTGPRGLTRLR